MTEKLNRMEQFDSANDFERGGLFLDLLEEVAVAKGAILETGSQRLDRIRMEAGDSLELPAILSEATWAEMKKEWIRVFQLVRNTPGERAIFLELLAEITAED